MKISVVVFLWTCASIAFNVQAENIPSLGIFNTFTRNEEGDLTRVADYLAGIKNIRQCIIHCTCAGYEYSYRDSDDVGACYCSNELATEECGNIQEAGLCSYIYPTLPPRETPTIIIDQTSVQIFSTVNLDLSSLKENVSSYEFYVESDGTTFRASTLPLPITISSPTTTKIYGSVEDGSGCFTDVLEITPYVMLKVNISCPQSVEENELFVCIGSVLQGTSVTEIKWTLNGIDDTPMIETPDPLTTAIGSEMTGIITGVDKSSGTAYVNQNWEVSLDGSILAFEASIHGFGEVNFAVYTPECHKGYHLCSATKSCELDNECINESEVLPQERSFTATSSEQPLFCAGAEAFVSENGDSGGFNVMDKPTVNYLVRCLIKVNVTKVGRQVYPLANETCFVRIGDVIGYFIENGDAAGIIHADINLNETKLQPVFKYSDVDKLDTGSVLHTDWPIIDAVANDPYLKVHVSYPSYFSKSHSFPSAGSHEVKFTGKSAQNTEGLSLSATVNINEKIHGLTILTDQNTYFTGESILFTLDHVSGTEVTYCVNWGKTAMILHCDNKTAEKTFTGSYEHPGIYVVIITAINDISYESRNVTVDIVAVTTQIVLFESTEPATPGNMTSISWAINSGGYHDLVVYTTADVLDDYQGTTETYRIWLSSDFIYKKTLAYPSPLNYAFQLTTINERESHSNVSYIIIEGPLSPLDVRDPDIVATNQTLNYTVELNSGSNITFVWNWDDGHMNTSDINEYTLSHLYNTSGNRTINVLGYNHVSNETTNQMQIVRDRIEGLAFARPIRPRNFTDVTTIEFLITQGTGVSFSVDFGDGNSSAPVNDMDLTGDFMLAVVEHVYDHIGYYNVTVKVWNNVSESTIYDLAIVEIPITEATIDILHENYYIEVDEKIIINVSMATGNSLSCEYIFDDGSFDSRTEDFIIEKSYNPYQLPYKCNVTCHNNVSVSELLINIWVQKPVFQFADLFIQHVAANTTQPALFYIKETNANDFNCSWKFGDTNTGYSSYFEVEDILKAVENVYDKPGVYKVNATCRNRLYHRVAITYMSAFDVVTRFDYLITYIDCYGEKNEGKGILLDSYPIEYLISIEVIRQYGTNVTFLYEFGDDEKLNTANKEVTHKYDETEPTNQRTALSVVVKVTASNPAHSITISKTINVMPSVMNITITNNGPVRINSPVHFEVETLFVGYQTCFVCYLDTSNSDDDFMFKSSSACVARSDLQNIKSSNKDPVKADYSFTFTEIKRYHVTVWGSNIVSDWIAETFVDVQDAPCSPPIMKWLNLALEFDSATPQVRSTKFESNVEYTIDCEKTNVVEYRWSLWKLDQSGTPIMESINVTAGLHQSVFIIPSRSLEYGFYCLHLNVTMEGVKTATNLIKGYIEIIPSELVPVITGGSGKAFGRMMLLEIDASTSHDPDVSNIDGKIGLEISWYCRSPDETYPNNDMTQALPIQQPEEIHPTALITNTSTARDVAFSGCFGNGPGHLIAYDNQYIITINTSFMAVAHTYFIELRLKSNEPIGRERTSALTFRLLIVDGDPPLISITCKQNCGVRKISNQKISLIANNTDGRTLNFLWSMSYRLANEKTAEFLPYDKMPEIITTTMTSKNLVIRRDSLDTAYTYIVRLKGWVEIEELAGFSEYQFDLNTPPQCTDMPECTINPPCHVLPEVGPAMEEIFIAVCEGFTDPDNPIRYIFSFRGSSNGTFKTLFESQSETSDLFMLPPSKEKDGKIEMKAEIIDSCQAVTEVYFYAMVKEAEFTSEQLSTILSGTVSNDPNKVSAATNSVLDAISGSGGDQVVSQCMEKLSKVDVNRPKDATNQLDTFLSALDKKSATLSEEDKLNAHSAIEKIAGFMSDDVSADEQEQITKGNLMLMAAAKNETDPDAKKKDEAMQKKMMSCVSAKKIPGEEMSVFETDDGASLMACSLESNGESGGVEGGGGSGATLPASVVDMGAGQVGVILGRETSSYQEDLNEEQTAISLQSKTLSLDISTEPCTTNKVEGLDQEIELTIPVEEELLPPEVQKAYIEVMVTALPVPCEANSSFIFLDIYPEEEGEELNLTVIINKNSPGSLKNHLHNYSLPNLEASYPGDEHSLPFIPKWRVIINNEDLNFTAEGTYFISVFNYIGEINMTQQTTINNNKTSPPYVNYTMNAYCKACLYWDWSVHKWRSDGCRIGNMTSTKSVQCFCTHLTSFGGGGILASPQPIDFSKAFAGFSNIGENPTVFSVVICIIGLYFILLIWCRRKDRLDKLKVQTCPLPDNHAGDTYFYEIAVQTGFKRGAGTTADVFIHLKGSQSEAGPRQLVSPKRKCFNKAETDKFLLSTGYTIGRINEIKVWHNNKGKSPAWNLMQIQIRDVQTNRRWAFVCNRWLAVEEDDGKIERTIEVSTKDDLVQFDFVFAQTARKNLYDGHIWFSVFTRPVSSTFTRCQRLACCLSLLLTTMLSNAMFYTGGDDAPAENSISIGPLTISVDQIRVGITSSLVVVPVNVIIVTLFSKARPKRKKTEKYEEEATGKEGRRATSTTSVDQIEEGKGGETQPPRKESKLLCLKSICFFGGDNDDENGKKKRKKNKYPLPHWVIYISYFLVFVSSLTSAFFVMLYGFSFGKAKSDKWVSSMMISLWQSVFVIQPLKVLALSLFIAFLIREPDKGPEDDESKTTKDNVKIDEDQKEKTEKAADTNDLQNFKLPSEQKLEEARKARLQEKRMKAIVAEIVVHLLFVILCLFIGYGNIDSMAFQYGNNVKVLAGKAGLSIAYNGTGMPLDQLTRLEDYFTWNDGTYLEFLFPSKWYNGNPNYLHGFVADNEASKFLSMARVRQLRVRTNTCTKYPAFKYLIRECNAFYSWSAEDTEDYGPGWSEPLNVTLLRNLRKHKRKAYWMGLESPWKYQSALELKNFPFVGRFATYGGGSYSVNIGPNKKLARRIVKNLKEKRWLDRYTRAIFTEMNIFNANSNLLLIASFINEMLPSGGLSYFDNIQVLRLYRYTGGIGSLIMLADLIFVIVTLAGIYKMVKLIRRQGKRYFLNPWQSLHAIVTGFSVAAIVSIILRAVAAKWAIGQYQDDPDIFVSFQYIGLLDYIGMGFVGLIVFVANFEFLRLLRFNKKISMLTDTMRASAAPLLSFGLVFFLIFVAYVSMGHYLYVDKIEEFRSFGSSFIALIEMFLGKFNVDDYIQHNPILGPFLFFSYMLMIQMILINFFIGIVCDAFAEQRIEAAKNANDHEVLSFMTNRFKKIAGVEVGPSVDPVYTEWQTDWEIMLENIENKANGAMYLIRNMEMENIRQTNWFYGENIEKKKKKLLLLIVGSEEFLYENEVCDGIQPIEMRLQKYTETEVDKMLHYYSKKKKLNVDGEADQESEKAGESENEDEKQSTTS